MLRLTTLPARSASKKNIRQVRSALYESRSVNRRSLQSGVPATEPVIIGVAPSPSSPHTHGRRKFLDENRNEDRNGPPRLKAASAAASVIKSPPTAAPYRVLRQKAPPVPSDKAGPDSEPEQPADPISLSLNSDAEDPKASKENTAPKRKLRRVHFVVPDDALDDGDDGDNDDNDGDNDDDDNDERIDSYIGVLSKKIKLEYISPTAFVSM